MVREHWKSLLKSDPTPWLLEENNPSIRYFALIDLLNKTQDEPQVVSAQERIMNTKPVYRILGTQKEAGYWGNPEKFYVGAKWRGTFFTLILLADLGASGEDKRIKKACEFLLAHSQVEESGGFAAKGNKDGQGGILQEEHPCMTGKMIRTFIHFGYLDDPRI